MASLASVPKDEKIKTMTGTLFNRTERNQFTYNTADMERTIERLPASFLKPCSGSIEKGSSSNTSSISTRTLSTVPISSHQYRRLGLHHYKPRQAVFKALENDYSEQDLFNISILFGGYILEPRLTPLNVVEVMRVLLEMEDLTVLERYRQLMQSNVTIRTGMKRNEYSLSWPNISGEVEDLLKPFMDEIVIVPQLSFEAGLSQFDKDFKKPPDVTDPVTFASLLKSDLLDKARSLKNGAELLFPHHHEVPSTPVDFRRYVATVELVSRQRIYFRLYKPPTNICSETFYIIFRPKRMPIRYQHRALDLLSKNEEMRQYMFPSLGKGQDTSQGKQQLKLKQEEQETQKEKSIENTPKKHNSLNLVNTKIAENPEQYEAVCNIAHLSNQIAPFIIFGPPGTGKTTTVVESILQLRLHNPSSRILVTAGTNSACDTIALRICKYFKSNVLLANLQAREDAALPLIRIFSKSIVVKNFDRIDPDLISNSNCPYRDAHSYPGLKSLHRYGIIVMTLSTFGTLLTGNAEGSINFFTHVFIDEAAASTEPETLVPLTGIEFFRKTAKAEVGAIDYLGKLTGTAVEKPMASCQLILSGDHKQLGQILNSEHASKWGLQKSMMQRLMETSGCYAVDGNGNYDRSLQARLRRNYRSHPEIVRLYNKLFYNSELLPSADLGSVNKFSTWAVLPNKDFPIIFHAVHGVADREEHSTSTFNDLEIHVLFWYLRRLLVSDVDGGHVGGIVKPEDIGIITPYRSQCLRINKKLQLEGWSNVEVGSVETYQGREKPIIIVSMVRSFSGLGFVRDPRRLNVMLSRPKSLLIMLGNPVTLRRCHGLKFVIEQCKKNGTYLFKKRQRNQPKRLGASARDSDEEEEDEMDTESESKSSDSENETDENETDENESQDTVVIRKKVDTGRAALDDVLFSQLTDENALCEAFVQKLNLNNMPEQIRAKRQKKPSLSPVKMPSSKLLRYSKKQLMLFDPNSNRCAHRSKNKGASDPFDGEELAKSFEELFRKQKSPDTVPVTQHENQVNIFESIEVFLKHFNRDISLDDVFSI